MTTEDRLAALEVRLQAAEDHLAILNLLNSYGPLVDSGGVETGQIDTGTGTAAMDLSGANGVVLTCLAM